jgi:hypothetical protein
LKKEGISVNIQQKRVSAQLFLLHRYFLCRADWIKSEGMYTKIVASIGNNLKVYDIEKMGTVYQIKRKYLIIPPNPKLRRSKQ